MRIYAMTATFGKLDHQVLTLEPGLNIIEAPNEWGKSTWCAFLVNMLYGIDTRARTTGAALADKERYAPWSGSPMAGRIDLNWKGRDITIERSTKGRVIFGNFRAYETETGLDVPELNGLNCGQQLLGVERSVFTRAGFLKLGDLPVTQDESLRRRLNNLVTTGDESGAGDKLGERLRDLKNKCRHNQTGLLPAAEREREQLKNQLSNLHNLQNQAEQIRNQQTRLEQIVADLENHTAALNYAAAEDNLRQAARAEEAVTGAKEQLEALMEVCAHLPPREETARKLRDSQTLLEQRRELEMEERMLPPMPEMEKTDGPCQSVKTARADAERCAALEKSKKKNGLILGIYALLAVAALAVGIWMPQLMLYMGIAVAVAGIAVLVVCLIRTGRIRRELQNLYDRYPGISPDRWIAEAEAFEERVARHEEQVAKVLAMREDLNRRKEQLQARMEALTHGPLADAQSDWAKELALWDALADARRDLEQKDHHAKVIRSMVRPVEPPKMPDSLNLDAGETGRYLADAQLKRRQLHTQLGQCQGQMEALGSEDRIRSRLDILNRRIARLEDTWYALEMAQDALRDATNSLQRRFAPRISKRAQELFGKLTGDRYQRLTLGEDLSLSVSAREEDTLHGIQWRSDGTADQLYLALRLAVAGELTPEAPLVLDDALVRFDDERLHAAMSILKEESQSRQVILFTCQHREKEWEDAQ